MMTTDIPELQAQALEGKGGRKVLASDNPKPLGSSDFKVTYMLKLQSNWKAYRDVMCGQE